MKCEYYLPSVVSDLLAKDQATVTVLTSKDKWYGVTYKEDADGVKQALKNMVTNNEYPNHLWTEK